jgi:phospholipase A1/A2
MMSTLRFAFLLSLLILALRPPLAHAQLAVCASIPDDRERLACFDALAQAERLSGREASAPPTPARASDAAETRAASELEKRWELRPDLKHDPFTPRAYKPLYALVHATNNINDSPASPTRSITTAQQIQLDRVEAKLQLSVKTKLAQDLFGSAADLWFGYTQLSYWQLANGRSSSPFRETDYEPEAILIYPLQLELAGIHARYLGLSLNHQSNGRGESLSRSWNRVIGEVALESGPWAFRLRPWLRIAEASAERNDNPDIEDFFGRGEIIAEYRAGKQVVSMTGRHTLRGGKRSRGSAQIDWAFPLPLTGDIKGHLQLFSGYGESLLDYNHRQTTLGLGVSFFD